LYCRLKIVGLSLVNLAKANVIREIEIDA
jgi:hypothetical protein